MTHIHTPTITYLSPDASNRTHHDRRIPDLFPKDELDALLTVPGPLRAEAKAQVHPSVYDATSCVYVRVHACILYFKSSCLFDTYLHPTPLLSSSLIHSFHTLLHSNAQGVPDTPAALLPFLIQRVRSNLHVVLTFSPVGQAFR